MKRSHRKFIIYDHTLEEYFTKYKHRRNRLLKYTRNEVDAVNPDGNLYTNKLLKGHNWWFIEGTYYEIPKPPRITWFRNLRPSIQIITSVILGGLLISAITVPSILLVNKLKNINANTDINVINEGDADEIINTITLKLTTTGDYIGNISYKDNKAFNFIETYTIKLNDNTLSRDKDYKLNAIDNTLTIFSKTTINKNSKVAMNIVKVSPSINIVEDSITINVGQYYDLHVNVKGMIGDVTWESDKESVAYPDTNGRVLGVIAGNAVITASLNGKEDTCTVTVE